MSLTKPTVIATSLCSEHRFSKQTTDVLELIAGQGIKGDAHCGVTVKHRSRVAKGPSTPNLRQVHLIHSELHAELLAAGFKVGPGVMGENITTQGIDLLKLPVGTILRLGTEAVIWVTGLRNPCKQLDDYQAGLTQAVLERDENNNLVRKAGVMAVVLEGGIVQAGDRIIVELPPLPHKPLERV
ncbi:molybdenum cofactor biosysynthesis protein [Kiloniella litopenaei]|uniref:Molybdenum cofactor biosysynthesis protein n=1 Tax=Kiloniella litopenaei TaxID=1549748 RepID=A0A0M2RFF0_9PROT|nr:MOSC domain-containing protein [Kiloniella litopenaei]KKJ78273.1 molybdenum cofactor biosysynthesis protein [Kiloniella litopenaei]